MSSYKLCVMGNPIQHSKSPWIHQQFARQLNLEIDYSAREPERDDFAIALDKFKQDYGHGLNVTLPFKQEAFQLATKTSERAAIAQAVNTILFAEDGNIYGDNTDGVGFINDITNNLAYSLTEKTILVLGSGGAVRGILQPLLSQQPAQLIIANRTFSSAEQLANEFSNYGNIQASTFADLGKLKLDVIIDGTAAHGQTNLPASLTFSAKSLAYTLNYGSRAKAFLQWAQSKNISQIENGLGMLVEQAAESFHLWTGQRPETQTIIKLAREQFFT